MSNSYKIKYFITMILFFSLNCNIYKPEDILQGEYKCEHCQMNIVNMSFQSQIISPKGKKYHFDSIECMTSWWLSHPELTKTLYVKNYANTIEWLELDKSFLIQSTKISSPMRANILAYSTLKMANQQIKENGGRKMNIDELKEFISNEWEKEIVKNQVNSH